MNVVHQDVSLGDAIFADGYNFGMRAIHAYALIAILAKNHRLPVFEVKNFVGSYAALGKVIEGAIVEDVAILIDFEERHAFVLRRGLDHGAEMLHIDVDRARDEGCFTRDRQ